MKQGANSAVRFASFSTLQQAALNYTGAAKLSSTQTFGIGAVAGLITVCTFKSFMANIDTTMPFDNVKTRMQSTGAETRYKHSLDCLQKVIREEGVKRLWGGTTPRLARLMLSGGIVFAVYDKIITTVTAV
jgi:solute carrier family 25 citrate transporter 1